MPLSSAQILKASAITEIQEDLEAAVQASADAAAGSATAAADSASAADTSATAAAGSATAASGSASAAAGSATTASGHASDAADSADTATTQADIATTKANEAAASAESIVGDVTDAETARTGAEAARDIADAKAVIATAQAVIASTKAAEASASATTALNALVGLYAGTYTAAALPTTLPAAGRYARISVAGTIYGITWAKGDIAIYSGTPSTYTQIAMDVYGFALEAEVASRLDAKQTAPWLYSTGGAYARIAGNARTALGDAQNAFYAVQWKIPGTASSDYGLFSAGESPGNWRGGSCLVGIVTGSSFGVYQVNSSGVWSTNARRFVDSNFMSVHAGKTVRMLLQFTKGTTAPVFEMNGEDISADFIHDTIGVGPDWLVPTTRNDLHMNPTTYPSGEVPVGFWSIGELSTTEKAEYFKTGRMPAWVMAGGSASPAIYNESFASGIDSWLAASASLGIATNASGELQFEGTASSGTVAIYRNSTLTIGKPVHIKATFRVSASLVGTLDYVGVRTSGNNMIGGVALNGETPVTAEFTFTPSASDTGGGSRLSFGFGQTPTEIYVGSALGAGSYIWGDDMGVGPNGALSWPVVGPDRVLRDATRIAPANDAYLTNINPQCADGDGWIRARRTSDGYLMADTQLVGDGRGITEIRATGDGTFSLGDSAAAPATVLSGATATSAILGFTPLKAVTTGGKIYLDLGTATDVTVWIKTGPLTALV